MSLTTANKVAILVAIIGAAGLVVAGLVPAVSTYIFGPHPTPHINGSVLDSVTKTPMSGVVVQLQTNDGALLTQETTDGDGRFDLAIPVGLSTIRLMVTADGYVPYDEKLPGQDIKNDIHLVRQPISFGIPYDAHLDSALRILAGKLNVTIVFSKVCNEKAATAALSGRELRGDPRVPEAILKDLLTQVKDNSLRYDVITVEAEKRYEVRCF